MKRRMGKERKDLRSVMGVQEKYRMEGKERLKAKKGEKRDKKRR